MIIGLTGPMGSGKSTLLDTFKELGYEHITLSSMIREECRKRGLPEEREILMDIGGELRSKYGAGILATKSLEKIQNKGGDKWIIDGIRNPAEIEALQKDESFVLIANYVPEDIIIERIMSRKRDDDTLDEGSIRKKLRREWGEGEPEDGQQVGKCIEMADYTFENTIPFEDVPNAIKELHRQIIKLKA